MKILSTSKLQKKSNKAKIYNCCTQVCSEITFYYSCIELICNQIDHHNFRIQKRSIYDISADYK